MFFPANTFLLFSTKLENNPLFFKELITLASHFTISAFLLNRFFLSHYSFSLEEFSKILLTTAIDPFFFIKFFLFFNAVI